MSNNKYKTTKHHRKPRSLGGKNNCENISHVPQNKHEAWHTLFENYTPDHIARIINNKWLDKDFLLIPIPIEAKDKEILKIADQFKIEFT